MRFPLLGAVLAALVAVAAPFNPAKSDGLTFFQPGTSPALLDFSAGGFAVSDNNGRDATGIFQIDAISRWTIVNFWDYFQVHPWLGGFVTAKGGIMGYGGIHGTIPVGPHFELDPFTGIGAYSRGGGKDLGSTGLFEVGLSGLYVFDSGYRAGVTFSHESNGTTLPRNRSGCVCNPGANNFLLTVGVPFSKLLSF